MTERFNVGDRVTWNSEAGHVSGTVIQVHTRNVDYKGYTHHASEEDPQYEIKAARPTISPCTKGRRSGRNTTKAPLAR